MEATGHLPRAPDAGTDPPRIFAHVERGVDRSLPVASVRRACRSSRRLLRPPQAATNQIQARATSAALPFSSSTSLACREAPKAPYGVVFPAAGRRMPRTIHPLETSSGLPDPSIFFPVNI